MQNFKLNFVNISSLLIYLLPIFLITGPFLSDLTVTTIAIFFIIYSFLKSKTYLFKNKFFYFFLIFWLYLVLNSILTGSNFSSLKVSVSYIRFGIFTIALSYIVQNNLNFCRNFFYSLLFCFIILIFDGFYQYFNGENIFGYPLNPINNRLSSFFGTEYILGSYLSRLFPLLFALIIILNKELKLNNFVTILIFALVETLIFLSGERAAFFYVNLSAIFIIIMVKDYKKIRIASITLSFLLIIVISFVNQDAKKRIIDQTANQMNLGSSSSSIADKKVYIFSKEHNDIYITAYNIFKDNKAFGVGIKNFRNECDKKKYKISKFSCSTHPHNTYLQLLTETGILGFSFIFGFLMYLVFNCLKHFLLIFKNKYFFSDFQICLISCGLITLWPLIPTGSFFNNWLSIIYYLPLGFLLSSFKKNKFN